MLLGALECGRTKMVCAVGEESGRIIEQTVIPTETPEITMPRIIDFFGRFSICAMGIACFGPLDLNRQSPTFGYITNTPKEDWRGFDILGYVQRELKVPCEIDTNVNGACLGEVTYGCMKGIRSGVYLTVGAGVGLGIYVNGLLVHGMLHPEGGHVLVRRHKDDIYEGHCPYHHDCLEGLVSEAAIAARAGVRVGQLPKDAHDWELVSYYIAQALVDYILILSPEKIVLGGDVMKQTQLFPMIRSKVSELLDGYVCTAQIKDIDNYIVPESLGGRQAVMGCMKLAYDAACLS